LRSGLDNFPEIIACLAAAPLGGGWIGRLTQRHRGHTVSITHHRSQ